jgi:uncharacterized protein (TIGR04255 family)
MATDPNESELSFPRPPIVEAVIERRFADPIKLDMIETLRRKFESDYPAIGQLKEMTFAIVPVGAEPQIGQNTVGYRLTNLTGSAIVVINTHAIAVSRLAPYPGWREFSRETRDIFEIARGIMGYSTLNRIGVRYINRLDIPIVIESGHPVPFRLEDYILIYPEYPESLFPAVQSYTMQCVAFLVEISSRSTISVATVPSPVPGRIGIVFDIDIAREANVPQREDEISSLLELIRSEKNRLFVSSLTEKAKALFQ